jgi:hypothetical protein
VDVALADGVTDLRDRSRDRWFIGGWWIDPHVTMNSA